MLTEEKDDEITQLDFSQVTPYKADFKYEEEEPIQWYHKEFISDRVYSITMSIEKLAFNDWIVFDKNYKKRMDLKAKVLAEVGSDAIDCRDEGYAGCVEMLECLLEYLPRRFPTIFKLSDDGKEIHNAATGETFDVSKPYIKFHPLYIAGRLVEDDLNILVEGPTGEYVLKAVLSAFPAGFHVREKMNQTLTDIHKPVPMYKERLQKSMNRFFRNVGPSSMVMRVNWAINDKEELFLTEGGHLYENDEGVADENIDINQVQLRVERQVLRRLPRTKAICFVTKTYLYRLVDIAHTPGFAARLGGLLHKLPEKFAFYKRKPVWGKVVLRYLDEMAAMYPALEPDTTA
ncbi:hypothetical protein A1O1_07120 [Capronia coronata CBS 617.96]|uniref:DUF3445 domain-containing protein n=1 Tax=Capronia coronata CBS 617.96 TaxID=1182541 RepID=W9XSH5_9EURO|nr:uncharacterized protein A1O1_07120 [Capronia coronata CBS 617.96]EXJ83497.1 hypothetical protein A1O1_07120 [Capronia coronata CBS 617.96]